MEIREANMNDLKVLLEFEQEIIKAEKPFDSSLKEETFYYNFPDLLSSSKVKMLVAAIRNEVVGSGFAEIRKADHFLKHVEFAYLGLMYVKPTHRGKGINKAILHALKKWIAEKKITEIRLLVYHENILAKNAYLKNGFKAHVLEMRMEI